MSVRCVLQGLLESFQWRHKTKKRRTSVGQHEKYYYYYCKNSEEVLYNKEYLKFGFVQFVL